MKFIICAVLLLSLISASLSAVSISLFKDPRYPGKCYISEDLILPPGEHKNPNADCERIFCSRDGTSEFQTCGVQRMKGFKSVGYEDKTLPYPECCKLKFVPE